MGVVVPAGVGTGSMPAASSMVSFVGRRFTKSRESWWTCQVQPLTTAVDDDFELRPRAAGGVAFGLVEATVAFGFASVVGSTFNASATPG